MTMAQGGQQVNLAVDDDLEKQSINQATNTSTAPKQRPEALL
jgi:hypothetical protein